MLKFNKSQINAIKHHKGPCLVLAGPGSGKTLTVVNRIHNLIQEYNVKPEEILVITFTKHAATEMEQRFYRLLKDEAADNGNGSKINHCLEASFGGSFERIEIEKGQITFGTFHSVFYKILRHNYRFNSSNILTDKEKYKLLQEIVNSKDIASCDDEDFLRDLVSEISVIKNNSFEIEEFESKCIFDNQIFREVFKDYEKVRRDIRKIDFDDMLVLCNELLSSRKEVLNKWQKQYKYILIDEFQDINRIQYDTIKMLAMPENNIFVVGDDDQSIYGFRGASSDLMFEFKKDFPGTKEILLNINYRSTPNILSKALKLITNNKKRFYKDINSNNSPGTDIFLHQEPKPSDESNYVIEEIRKKIDEGVGASDIAVLYRVHSEAKILVEKLVEKEIPFQMKEKMHNIFEHFIAKDIIAYFNIALGSRKRKDFLQIMNRPLRYIGRDSLEQSEVSFEKLSQFYLDKEWMLDKIDIFENDIGMLKYMAPYSGIQYIRKRIGYDDFLDSYVTERNISATYVQEILASIEESSRAYATLDKWLAHIDEYTALLEEQEKKDEPEEGVHLMTIHASKGLEFNTVFIIGANEGLIPYKRNIKDNLEEERRLLYVAMTRAKESLTITYVNEKNGIDLSPSRFIDELY